MEINRRKFDSKCPLLLELGYRIIGEYKEGIMIKKIGEEAIPTILSVCSIQCPFFKKGCTPSYRNDDKKLIIAKVE